MQRDAYAILIKKRGKITVPIRILQLSGEVTSESIFDEVFDGYKQRRIVLMTNMAKSDPAKGPLLPRDVVVDDFEKLQKVHQPHFSYKLLPLLCTDMATLACLQGICGSPGSPFRIEQRRDPTAVRVGWMNPRSPLRDEVWNFFEPRMSAADLAVPRDQRTKMPCGTSADLDGLLLHKTGTSPPAAVALLAMRPHVTTQVVEEFANMMDLFHSPVFRAKIASNIPLFADIAATAAGQRFHFIGTPRRVDSTARTQILTTARSRGIGIYEMNAESGEYFFAS